MNLSNFRPSQYCQVPSILFLALFSLSGCNTTHTQFLSDHWVAQSSALHLVSTNPNASRLQVIITYDGPLSSHSALRLESDNGKVTFWDPLEPMVSWDISPISKENALGRMAIDTETLWSPTSQTFPPI